MAIQSISAIKPLPIGKAFSAGLAALVLTAMAPPAQAGVELVLNGDFELSTYTVNHQFSSSSNPSHGGQGVTDWTGNNGYDLYYFGGTATTVGAITQYGGSKEKLWGTATFSGTSPNGGNFIAMDGDSGIRGGVSQMIHGLTAGDTYTLSFDWGASQLQSRTGRTTEQLEVSLGSDLRTTAVVVDPSKGFTGWFGERFTFTASSSTELLKFLSIGTPNGAPPLALLDSVSLQAAVPEPATLTLLGIGAGLVGLVARRRAAKRRDV